MEVINARYKELCSTPSDINEHLPVLRGYAARSSTVAEFGVRGIVSTWALLKGLAEGLLSDEDKRLVCVDVEAIPGIDRVAELAADVGVELHFLQGDSAKLTLPFDVDLLFIVSAAGPEVTRTGRNGYFKMRRTPATPGYGHALTVCRDHYQQNSRDVFEKLPRSGGGPCFAKVLAP